MRDSMRGSPISPLRRKVLSFKERRALSAGQAPDDVAREGRKDAVKADSFAAVLKRRNLLVERPDFLVNHALEPHYILQTHELVKRLPAQLVHVMRRGRADGVYFVVISIDHKGIAVELD